MVIPFASVPLEMMERLVMNRINKTKNKIFDLQYMEVIIMAFGVLSLFGLIGCGIAAGHSQAKGNRAVQRCNAIYDAAKTPDDAYLRDIINYYEKRHCDDDGNFFIKLAGENNTDMWYEERKCVKARMKRDGKQINELLVAKIGDTIYGDKAVLRKYGLL